MFVLLTAGTSERAAKQTGLCRQNQTAEPATICRTP
nr:MAG TPA: hypothetical protein [Caudoviricetes sp.]